MWHTAGAMQQHLNGEATALPKALNHILNGAHGQRVFSILQVKHAIRACSRNVDGCQCAVAEHSCSMAAACRQCAGGSSPFPCMCFC